MGILNKDQDRLFEPSPTFRIDGFTTFIVARSMRPKKRSGDLYRVQGKRRGYVQGYVRCRKAAVGGAEGERQRANLWRRLCFAEEPSVRSHGDEVFPLTGADE